ncbi:MAG: hypothetical protein WC575_00780 [Patescibacteria group bacterium]
MPTKEQLDFFQSLSEQKKIRRIKKALESLISVSKRQLFLLDKYEKSARQKEMGFAYFFRTLKYTWENVDFALDLSRNRNRRFNIYPTRLICENVFRLEYYIKQKKKEQNEICLWEMLRLMKRYYDEYGDLYYRNSYEGMVRDLGEKGTTYPNIDDKTAYHDPFPSIEQLVTKSNLPSTKGFYIHYRYLCEGHHGKLLAIYIADNEIAQCRRNLLLIALFCKWLLLITDSHIEHATKEMVAVTIKKADDIIFSITN